ncbi:MAG TPA: hypothetical protein VIM16_07135 [Mucilaginibacter sp.]|jgi:hypothetical protein
MKKSMYLLATLLVIASSCKKPIINAGNQTSTPPPLMYVVLDKNGNNILDTPGLPKDSVTLTCSVSGVNTQFCDSIFYVFKKNNEIVAFDYKMILLSTGVLALSPLQTTSPVNTFNLSYHGTFLGTVYFEYLGWNHSQTTSWQEAKVFTFNNLPVKIDSASGAHIYVIQL